MSRNAKAIVVMLFCFYVPLGILLAYSFDWRWIWLAFFPLDFFLVSFCFVALHECGHALAGWLVGYEMRSLAVGPLLLEATPQGVRSSFRRGSFFTGFAKIEPRPDLFQPWRQLMFVLGGPAVSVIAVVLLLMLLLGGELSLVTQWQVWFIIAVIGVDFAWNMTQTQIGEVTSDRTNIWRLFRHGRDWEWLQVQNRLFQESQSGLRPRDWTVGRVELLLSHAPKPRKWDEIGIPREKVNLLKCLGFALAYYRAWDSGEYLLASKLLDRLVKLPQDHLPMGETKVLAEAAFCAATFRRDAASARDFLDRARARYETEEGDEQQRLAARLDLLRAEVAIHVIEGQEERARATCQEWLSLVGDLAENWPILRQVEREWIEGVERKYVER